MMNRNRSYGGGGGGYGRRSGGLPSLFDNDIYSSGGVGSRYRDRERSPVGRGPTSYGRSAFGHVVHMRGLPFKATASDIIEVNFKYFNNVF